MEYREYMVAVEELLSHLSDEQKKQWIRQAVRNVDQAERSAVLARFSELRETTTAIPLTEEQQIQALTLVMTPDEIREWLDALAEDEELGLKKYFSADEDYYESSLPSEIVLDPYELMDTMKKAFRACCQW